MTRVDDDAMRVAKEIGMLIADMHNSNIVHGDLTTSESPAFILYISNIGKSSLCLGASFLTPHDIILISSIYLVGVSMIAHIS